MQDGSFITRVFIVAIMVMLFYGINNYMNHKQNLEKLVLDQQQVIDEQNIAIERMQRANLIMYQYITQQQNQSIIH